MSTGAARARRGERGSAALEFIATFPILLFAGLVALQLGLIGWATVSTNDAARAAARAAALGNDPQAAAQGALPGGLRVEQVTGGPSGQGYTYTVTVQTPRLIPMFDFGTVSRTADMPAYK